MHISKIQKTESSFQSNLLILLFLFIGVLIGVLTAVVTDSSKAAVWALNVGTFLALAVPLGYIFIKRLNLLQPITVFSFTALGYFLETAYLIGGAQSPTMLRYTVTGQNLPFFSKAVLYVFIGVVCYQMAYLVTANWRTKLKTSLPVQIPAHYSKFRLYVIVTAFFLVGLLGYYLFVSSSGGLVYLIANINRRTLLRTSDYYRLLFQFMQTASWVWLAYDSRARRRTTFWLLVTLNLIGLVSLGNRTDVILYVFALIVLVLLKSRQYTLTIKRGVQFVLLIGFFLVMSFVFLAWRNATIIARNEQPITTVLVMDVLKNYDPTFVLASTIARANLASIQPLSIFVEYIPEHEPFMSGKSIYWILLTPIPRALWPEKPVIQLGVYVRQLVNPNGVGAVPVSWLAELYLNFGILGIIGGSLLFGYVSGKFYNWFVRYNGYPEAMLLYGSYIIYFMFLLTKSELTSALVRFLPLVICILITHYFFRVKYRRKKYQ